MGGLQDLEPYEGGGGNTTSNIISLWILQSYF